MMEKSQEPLKPPREPVEPNQKPGKKGDRPLPTFGDFLDGLRVLIRPGKNH
jgi:hypothetical protein